ncbi:MAG: mechanosensitive ion channel family protein [Bacilli bacterium]|jgi:small conductance mechanosensitive channel|nr:mechanosensitive ion channel family protein [Bacilli bacterium]
MNNNYINDTIKYLSNNQLILMIAIIIITLIICLIIPKLVDRIVMILVNDNNKRKMKVLLRSYCNIISTIIKIIICIIAFFLILIIYHVKITMIITSAGFIGVLITYIFQDPIKDITNGLYIVFTAPFDVGDYVEIESFVGKVSEVKSRYVIIKNAAGDVCIVNNRKISKIVVLNKKIILKRK